MSLKIYLAHPITGLTDDQVTSYYNETRDALEKVGYNVYLPMTGKGEFRTKEPFQSTGYHHPVATDKAIMGRDHWMVLQSDVVYVNFEGSAKTSIGCCMELAWAFDRNRHTVAVIPDDNVHKHAFILQCSNIVFKTHPEAMEYLEKLGQMKR